MEKIGDDRTSMHSTRKGWIKLARIHKEAFYSCHTNSNFIWSDIIKNLNWMVKYLYLELYHSGI